MSSSSSSSLVPQQFTEEEVAMLRHALEVGKEAATAAARLLQECYRIRADSRAALAEALDAKRGSASARGGEGGGSFEDNLLDVECKSGDTDLVTKYDKECEDIIIKIITEKTPTFAIISEERNPSVRLGDGPTWIIDPIDGTMDFVHGLMDCCVSVGLAYKGKATLGIVHCPFVGPAGSEGELVYGGAAVGGAWLNGRKLRPLAPVASMRRAIVSLNMPWRPSQEAIEAATGIRRELLNEPHCVRGIRMYGAAVFQEVQVALGRIDGYSEPGGKIWDVAAGAALIEAVGGTVLSLEGEAFALEEHTITCGASREVAEVMAGLCRKYDFRKQYWM